MPVTKPAAKKKAAAPSLDVQRRAANGGDDAAGVMTEDNPGNAHAVGVGDHVFFHKDGKGPMAGRVAAHGVHGCLVEDDAKARHKVKWGRVLGLKAKATLPAKVVDKGVGGAILEHEGGRRVFVAGDLPIPDEPAKLTDLSALERRAGMPRATRMDDLEPFARKQADMAKSFASDHDCEGPALCVVCRGRQGSDLMAKSLSPGVDRLADVVAGLRARRSSAPASRRISFLLLKR